MTAKQSEVVAQPPSCVQSRVQSALYRQPAKQVCEPSARQTPVRQSSPPSAAQLVSVPPTALLAAGPNWQVPTMSTAGYSAGSVEGVQKSAVPLPARLGSSPQSAPAEPVSVTHAVPQLELLPQ